MYIYIYYYKIHNKWYNKWYNEWYKQMYQDVPRRIRRTNKIRKYTRKPLLLAQYAEDFCFLGLWTSKKIKCVFIIR